MIEEELLVHYFIIFIKSIIYLSYLHKGMANSGPN